MKEEQGHREKELLDVGHRHLSADRLGLMEVLKGYIANKQAHKTSILIFRTLRIHLILLFRLLCYGSKVCLLYQIGQEGLHREAQK